VLCVAENAAFRARFDWDVYQTSLVAELMELLARKPGTVVHTLQNSRQGFREMIAAWDALEGYLEKHGYWTPPQRSLAFDLLGTNKVVRDSGRTELDPRPGDGTTAASRAQRVITREIERLKQRAALPVLREMEE